MHHLEVQLRSLGPADFVPQSSVGPSRLLDARPFSTVGWALVERCCARSETKHGHLKQASVAAIDRIPDSVH